MTGPRRAGDRVERVGHQVDQDLLERVRRRRRAAAGRARSACAASRRPCAGETRAATVTRTRIGPTSVRLLAGVWRRHRELAQIRHQHRQPLGLVDDVAGEVEHLVELDALLFQQQLDSPLMANSGWRSSWICLAAKRPNSASRPAAVSRSRSRASSAVGSAMPSRRRRSVRGVVLVGSWFFHRSVGSGRQRRRRGARRTSVEA